MSDIEGDGFVIKGPHAAVKWYWTMANDWGTTSVPAKFAPNWFQRWVLRVFCGIHWRRANV